MNTHFRLYVYTIFLPFAAKKFKICKNRMIIAGFYNYTYTKIIQKLSENFCINIYIYIIQSFWNVYVLYICIIQKIFHLFATVISSQGRIECLEAIYYVISSPQTFQTIVTVTILIDFGTA